MATRSFMVFAGLTAAQESGIWIQCELKEQKWREPTIGGKRNDGSKSSHQPTELTGTCIAAKELKERVSDIRQTLRQVSAG